MKDGSRKTARPRPVGPPMKDTLMLHFDDDEAPEDAEEEADVSDDTICS